MKKLLWKLAFMLDDISQYIKKHCDGEHFYIVEYMFDTEDDAEKFEDKVYKKVLTQKSKLRYRKFFDIFD